MATKRYGNVIDDYAYELWLAQRGRCYVKSHASYKHYGQRGIRVIYSSSDFRAWFRENNTSGDLKGICISRIDHDKNYEFGNIKIESLSANAKECRDRTDGAIKKKKVIVRCRLSGEIIGEFRSVRASAKAFNLHHKTIVNRLKNRVARKDDIIFEYGDMY